MKGVLVLALAIGAGGVMAAQSRSVPGITIDVIAHDPSGRTIDSLGSGDFTVRDPSASLTIDAVRFVRTAPAAGAFPPIASAADEMAAATESARLVAIFLDEFHVAPGSRADRAREALVQFVRHDLGPADLLVVLKPLDSLIDIRLSRDRDAAIRAIEAFSPRRGDYVPRTPFERNYIAGAPARIDSARAQIAASSLDALARHLGRFAPVRKTLIVVSEGFAGSGRRRGDEFLPSLDSVSRAANRAGVAVYAIDPYDAAVASGGEEATVLAARRDALRSLSAATGGRAIYDGEDVAAGLRQAIGDASGYYVLTLSSSATVRDGRVHPIDVAVQKQGVVVRARRGYFAASGEDDESRLASLSPPALPYSARIPRRTSPIIRPWFGMARASDGGTRISFVWEPAPRVPGDRAPAAPPAQIALSVTTMEGEPVFDGVVLASGGVVASGTGQARATFEAPTGRLLVQMAIQDLSSRVLDRDVRDLVVGRFPGPVTFGTAEIMRARTAREFQALAADANASPVATRQFSRLERLLVRVPVFSSGERASVSARLVSGMGSAMRTLVVTDSPSTLAPYQVDLSLAGLAAGVYSLELTATTSAGEARESVAFRVTP